MFLHRGGTPTGLVTILETDDFSPVTPELDWSVQWMFPGLRKQTVASYQAKSLEISLLASKFDALIMDPKSMIPTIDLVRYQPRPGVERQAVRLLQRRFMETQSTNNNF